MEQLCLPESTYNFAAGPGIMPHEVLVQAQRNFVNWNDSGSSILETPFTCDAFKNILRQTRETLRTLLNIPDNYHILFMHGGASAQFSLVPLNLLGNKQHADYIDTGYWSAKNIREASRYCEVSIVASSATTHYDHFPNQWLLNKKSAYCHLTSNETANGIQLHHLPETGDMPLVADMTSDFLSRPLEVARYGLIYAGAQKNIGPAGVTIVIVRDDLLGRAHPTTPLVFNYTAQADADSMLQTPVTFSIYLTGLVLQWINAKGGASAMKGNSERRSAMLYRAIDNSNDFYHCRVQSAHRSHMNICFNLANDSLTPTFLSEATAEGLLHLKGHPMTGGIRASLYNAMPDAGVIALTDFMRHFAEKHRHHV